MTSHVGVYDLACTWTYDGPNKYRRVNSRELQRLLQLILRKQLRL